MQTTSVRKVAVLGDVGPSRTEFLRQALNSPFSPSYLQTVGVWVGSYDVCPSATQDEELDMRLVVWDLACHHPDPRLLLRRLQGVAAYLLVADASLPGSIEKAAQLGRLVEEHVGQLPHVGVIYRSDPSSPMYACQAGECDACPWFRLGEHKTDNLCHALQQLAMDLKAA